MERKAVRELRSLKYGELRKTTLIDVVEDSSEYLRLRYLRENIININTPWQGMFAHWWTVWPKNEKYIKPFEPFEITVPALLRLSPADQQWADMSTKEFFEGLVLEEKGYDISKLVERIEDGPNRTLYKFQDSQEEEWINS